MVFREAFSGYPFLEVTPLKISSGHRFSRGPPSPRTPPVVVVTTVTSNRCPSFFRHFPLHFLHNFSMLGLVEKTPTLPKPNTPTQVSIPFPSRPLKDLSKVVFSPIICECSPFTASPIFLFTTSLIKSATVFFPLISILRFGPTNASSWKMSFLNVSSGECPSFSLLSRLAPLSFHDTFFPAVLP